VPARLKPYLVNSRAVDRARVIVIDGGYVNCGRRDLWIVRGVESANPSQQFQPKDIRYRKGESRKRDYDVRCNLPVDVPVSGLS